MIRGMRVTRAIPITPDMLTATSIAEADHPVWDIATAYTKGDRVMLDHVVYEAVSTTGNTGKNQCERLLAALAQFPVTTFEAMRHLDVYHVPARVLQLRKAGHPIVTLRQTVETEAGVPHRVGLYILQRGGSHA